MIICPHRSAILKFKASLVLGAALLFAGATTPNLMAQSLISGDIAGTVVDSSGAAVAGATVTVTNTDTGAVSTLTTNGSGAYHASLLKPGHYKLSISASGFQPSIVTTDVTQGQTAGGNATLSVGSSNQTVEVTGTSASLLQPDNADLGTTINQEVVQNLPNPGGDITYYTQITPGAVMNTQGGYGNTSVFGLPATSNNFTINGAEENDPFLNLNNSGPSNLLLGSNDVDEVNVVDNAYSAQYGSLGGIQENIITRSGSNQFHGNATYWWTNSDMNANDWFNDYYGDTQPFSNANQWGAGGGGPIKKDRAWFFANYEALRFVTAPADQVIIPSAAYQSLVLSNLTQIGQAAQAAYYQKVFALYNATPGAANAQPYATDSAGFTYGNVIESNPRNNLAENLVTGRLDLKLAPNDSMFAHFKWDHGVQPTVVDPIDSAFNSQSDQPAYEGQLAETHTFSPNLVNQFLFAASWYSAVFTQANPAASAAALPFNIYWLDSSFTELGGENYAFPQGRNVTQYQFNDDVSWTKGNHTFSFGGTFKRDNVTDYDLGNYTTPLGEELGPADDDIAGDAGDYFANGSMYLGVQNFPQHLTEPIALYNLGVYGQDSWKVKHNLLLVAGLRVEHNSNPICVTNCFGRFDDSYQNITATDDTAYNSVIQTGLHTAFDNLQKVALDPRVGFTWSPKNNSNTVVRGGFGLFTDVFPATFADDLLSNAPLNPQFTAVGYNLDPTSANGFTNALSSVNQSFQAGFATNGTYNSISASNPNFTAPNVFNADKNIHYPTYEEWSFQVQQQIGKSTSFQIGYVGNHGYHEPVVNNSVNASQSASESIGVDASGNAIYFGGLPVNPALPAFAQVTEIQSAAVSNYHGLLATIKHDNKYVTVQANYTWSHAMDEISNGGFLNFGGNAYNPINPFNLKQNYGNADYNLTNNFNAYYLVRLPYWGGPKLLTDGWRLGGTFFIHGGFPFSVTDSNVTNELDLSGTYGGTALASVTNPAINHHCKVMVAANTSCFNSADFTDATSFANMNQERNTFTGANYFNTDFSVTKSFTVKKLDSSKFEIGAQAYNVLNHPNFANPAFDYGNLSTFGETSATVSVPTSVYGSFLGGDASPRIIQLKANIAF